MTTMRTIRRTTRRTQAFGAVVLAASLTVGAAACGDDDEAGTADGSGDVTVETAGPTGNNQSVMALEVGQCVDDFGSGTGSEVTEVPTVDCAQPHTYEVYATFDLEGDEYPGLDQVETLAGEGCYERFEAYVGLAYESSALDINYLYPLEDEWNQAVDREVVCFLFNLDGSPLTGSAEGSAR
ncbi:MAG: septum formation family protein [Acidimicrobiales bacterium]|jgi:hypothetical protein|nr:septum formation family protein [Acidimicrobiales bacterium]